MRILSNEKGFTLIEVIAAIIIFSVSLLLFNVYFVNGFSNIKRQDSQLVAMNIARQFAEQWKAGNGTLIDKDGTTLLATSSYKKIAEKESEILGESFLLSNVTLNGITYEPTIVINKLEPLYTIQITVKQAGGDSILATLHTAIANPKKGD
ncbi:type II secretion system protein [Aneurinibacillus aneurinilyticus]|uniref:type IV pilus modification PilV family protein n=1 Tax=Aneurinibacillus aneurinilyticus TaxID=1391 RepID=UPI002E1E909B|nr:type II secretion system protein [Aneurinibacillus aneurinilyticus]